MAITVDIDEELINSDEQKYKIRSCYQKNNLVHVKFETKYGMHRGTYKLNKLYINPETGVEYIYDEIEKAVTKLFSTDTNKTYSAGITKNIDSVLSVGELTTTSATETTESIKEQVLANKVERAEETLTERVARINE